MPPNNPYIQKVIDSPNILHIPSEIYAHAGKWNKYFWNHHPLVLEIGTGMGNFFSKQVQEQPEKNFLGMEIRYKRCFQTAEKSRTWENTHFVILKDFWEHIDQIFAPEEVSETYIFFPDPWANKKRQKKHRLIQEDFLKKLYRITQNWGKVFFKTDHREYFDSAREIVWKQWLWTIKNWTHNYENTEIFDMWNITEFEGLYRGEKTDINYMELIK